MFTDVCKDLDIPKPDYLINKINTKSNISMISYFMVKISKVLKNMPTIVVLFGDVDTTIAGALASKKVSYNTC